MKKVITTIVLTLFLFTEKHPRAWIYIQGSNSVRTRFYKIAISNNLVEVRKEFFILGLKAGNWIDFDGELNYEAFLLQRKKV